MRRRFALVRAKRRAYALPAAEAEATLPERHRSPQGSCSCPGAGSLPRVASSCVRLASCPRAFRPPSPCCPARPLGRGAAGHPRLAGRAPARRRVRCVAFRPGSASSPKGTHASSRVRPAVVKRDLARSRGSHGTKTLQLSATYVIVRRQRNLRDDDQFRLRGFAERSSTVTRTTVSTPKSGVRKFPRDGASRGPARKPGKLPRPAPRDLEPWARRAPRGPRHRRRTDRAAGSITASPASLATRRGLVRAREASARGAA